MAEVSDVQFAPPINIVTTAELGSLAGLDIETALMVVMAKRLESLENQLRLKLAAIEASTAASAALLTQLSDSQALDPPGEASAGTKALQNQLSAANNVQQMDLIYLQSLSSKRGEAYEMLSNLMKKIADGRGRIVGNMS